MAEIDTSSYLRPQPPTNALDQITQFGHAADALGNVAAGQAVQGAILPDGSIDRNALAQSLKGSVAGSMKAIPTLNAYEQLRQAGHVADEAGLDNFQKRMALINHLFGGLASRDNPTINDVNAVAARVLDPAVNGPKYGITFPVVMNALKNFRGPDGRPLPPDQIRQRALDLQTMTGTTSEQLAAHSPRYSVQDDGNQIKFVPTGTETNPRYPVITKRIPTGTPTIDTNPQSPTYRQSVLVPPQAPAPDMSMNRQGGINPSTPGNPLAGAIGPSSAVLPQGGGAPPVGSPVAAATTGAPPASFAERYGASMAGAPAAGLKPGAAAAATSTAENSAHMGNALVSAANEVPQTRAILDNLERTVKDFTPGPGADYKLVAKAFANTVLPESWQKEGSVLDPKSVASQEEFNKLAYNLAQNQFQALGGTGTDAKLDSTMHTSPNQLMSKYGIQGVLSLLKGNTDALAVKAKAWNDWKKKNGEDSFADFSDQFNMNFNPRVFQFQYIPKKDRQSWYRAMSPDDRRNFEDAADYALKQKWLKPDNLK